MFDSCQLRLTVASLDKLERSTESTLAVHEQHQPLDQWVVRVRVLNVVRDVYRGFKDFVAGLGDNELGVVDVPETSRSQS